MAEEELSVAMQLEHEHATPTQRAAMVLGEKRAMEDAGLEGRTHEMEAQDELLRQHVIDDVEQLEAEESDLSSDDGAGLQYKAAANEQEQDEIVEPDDPEPGEPAASDPLGEGTSAAGEKNPYVKGKRTKCGHVLKGRTLKSVTFFEWSKEELDLLHHRLTKWVTWHDGKPLRVPIIHEWKGLMLHLEESQLETFRSLHGRLLQHYGASAADQNRAGRAVLGKLRKLAKGENKKIRPQGEERLLEGVP